MTQTDSVPWTVPGLLAGFDFDPAQYTAVEVQPVRQSDGHCDRVEPDSPDVAMWSVYVRAVPDADGFRAAVCVADLSNECAALSVAAALCAQYGFDPGADTKVELMMMASGAARYVIEPQRDMLALVVRNEASADETSFCPCVEDDAEIWAVMRYEPGEDRGEAEPVADCASRAEAVAFINGQRAQIGGAK